MISNIPKFFELEDTIFHYTTRENAINYILPEKRLRFSPRKNSKDPIENRKISTSQGGVYWNNSDMDAIITRTKSDMNKIIKQLTLLDNNTKQLCFCKNEVLGDNQVLTIKPLEHYGFLKPRMWDQYAKGYSGICISFSKEKLIMKHKAKFDNENLYNKINYIPYENMFINNTSLDHNRLDSIGYENYLDQCTKGFYRTLFCKHKDYSGEHEFRMLAFTKEEFDYLDIKGSINGVIASTIDLTKTERIKLADFCDVLEIPLYYINWTKSNITLESRESAENIQKIFLNTINNSK